MISYGISLVTSNVLEYVDQYLHFLSNKFARQFNNLPSIQELTVCNQDFIKCFLEVYLNEIHRHSPALPLSPPQNIQSASTDMTYPFQRHAGSLWLTEKYASTYSVFN